MSELIYELQGAKGKRLKVYDDKAIISCDGTLAAKAMGVPQGEKTIYYKDCLSVNYKPYDAKKSLSLLVSNVDQDMAIYSLRQTIPPSSMI